MTDDQIQAALVALRNISHGGQSGPKGLEAVAMAIGGECSPGHNNVCEGLSDIADAIRELADAVRDLNPDTLTM